MINVGMLLAIGVLVGGCMNQVDAAEKASAIQGVPLCSDVLSGDAPIPESGNCIEDEP